MSILFPPKACRFYAQGACFHAEFLNPGLEEAFRCAHLARMLQYWDDFVDRAEVFKLTTAQAGRIWNILASRRLNSPALCPHGLSAHPDHGPAAADEGGDCAYLVQGVCLLSLPRCKGRCEYYSLAAAPKRDYY